MQFRSKIKSLVTREHTIKYVSLGNKRQCKHNCYGIYATEAIGHNNKHNVHSEAKIPATVLLARHRTVGGRKFRIWVAAKGGMQTLVLQIENCERMVL